jgi:NhaA family Na+:H+ antiporter
MKIIKEFLKSESLAGILLAMAAVLALIIKNSSAAYIYDTLTDASTLFFVNDGLMTIFFLLIGLEIKREMSEGNLATKSQLVLPALAAFGGMVVPAVIYSFVNWSNQVAIKGWAIPTATDIAFALGVLTLLGKRVSNSLKLCLLTLAILDDLIAVVIIAIFYTQNISFIWLAAAAFLALVLAVMNRSSIKTLIPYLAIGLMLWVCVLNSGIHATIAGVLLAFFIPLQAGKARLLIKLEHAISPWVAYLILPVFAFANAGISIKSISIGLITSPITIGVASGLFFGKQAGVMLLSAIGVRTGLCKLPHNVTWVEYYGMALITGVGFTMSLFIGALAFNDSSAQTAARLGIITGSIASGLAGYTVMKIVGHKQR